MNKSIIKKIKKIKESRSSLKWWNSLPIQNLEEPLDSWSGYCMKYFSNKTNCCNLTDAEIQYIWKNK